MSATYPTPEETQLRNLERFDKILDVQHSIIVAVEELRRGMAAMAEVMVTESDLEAYALRSELGDLRAEVAEATATPFTPPAT